MLVVHQLLGCRTFYRGGLHLLFILSFVVINTHSTLSDDKGTNKKSTVSTGYEPRRLVT